jgi:hypothetical protein
MPRNSRFLRILAFVGLAALGACVGPDLEPPFSGSADKPQAPNTAPDSGAEHAGAAGSSSGTVGSSAPSDGTSTTTTKGSAGAGGSRASESDEDAGVAP